MSYTTNLLVAKPCRDGTSVKNFTTGLLTDGGMMNTENYSHYHQRVAAYAKSKPKKFIVTIAPALWRGRPVDMTYHFFKTFLNELRILISSTCKIAGKMCC